MLFHIFNFHSFLLINTPQARYFISHETYLQLQFKIIFIFLLSADCFEWGFCAGNHDAINERWAVHQFTPNTSVYFSHHMNFHIPQNRCYLLERSERGFGIVSQGTLFTAAIQKDTLGVLCDPQYTKKYQPRALPPD